MKDIDVYGEMEKIYELTDYKEQVHKTLELLVRIFDNRDEQYGDFRDNFEHKCVKAFCAHQEKVVNYYLMVKMF